MSWNVYGDDRSHVAGIRRRKPAAIWPASLLTALLTPLVGTAIEVERPPRTLTAEIGGAAIQVHVARPSSCVPRGALLVFHGRQRNALDYLEYARRLAEHHCLLLAAPEFDKRQFSNQRYQRGGIMRRGRPRARVEWAGTMVSQLTDWVRHYAGSPELKIWLFGHSAGGQFLSRAAAYDPPVGIERIVIANPSSYVVPSVNEEAPYGFAQLYAHADAPIALATYLAQPVTIYLGGADTGRRHLHNNAAARRQGSNRLERGRRVFERAQIAAARLGVPCNWTLVVAPGISHNARKMLDAPQSQMALGLPPARGVDTLPSRGAPLRPATAPR